MKTEYIIIDGKQVERLRCPHHPDKFILPSRQRVGQHIWCSKCGNEWNHSPEARKRRAKRWDSEVIFCARCPERRCNRALYVCSGYRRCSSCCAHRADGTRRPAYQRGLKKEKYDAALRRRRSGATGKSLTALQLFVRNTGMQILGAF